MTTTTPNITRTIFDLVDAVVEVYLSSIIKPFLKFHETFYKGLNAVLRKVLDDKAPPTWFTANFITYFRTVLVIPTLVLLAWDHSILPAIVVVAVDFGDFLDGVVARYWVDQKKVKEQQQSTEKDALSRAASPAHSDDESFEVVTTGSPHSLQSWVRLHRNRTYGGFVDAVCDKAFVVPCWILLLHTIPSSTYFKIIQYVTLFSLILAEVASACIRFQAYFTAGGVPAPTVKGLDFSTSAVNADHIGKAKQTFEMVGTALFILPITRYVGMILLALAVPLAYESVRRKVKKRVIYVVIDHNAVLDHKVLKFWMQAKAMGSKLIVGVVGKSDMVLTACAVSCVDQVIAEAPAKADLMFLERQSIDYCVSTTGIKFVTDEVIQSGRCLMLGEDGVAQPMTVKPAEHKE